MAKATLVIFDFDGTLVDSRKLITESNRVVFDQFGLSPPSEKDSFALVGMSLDLVLQRLAGPDAPIAQMVAAYQRVLPVLRADLAFVETPFDGASTLLAALFDHKNTRLGLATSHASSMILPALERFGWQNYFCTVQTADKAPSKPHPGMILQALKETGTDANDALIVGDTTFDMEMARAADVRGIGVSWGYHSHSQLHEARAFRIVSNMRELSDYLLGSV